jgi:transposase-like protein
MARKKRISKRLSAEEKAKIIGAAAKHGWTAAQVEKKFGVSRWTYYGWRGRTARTRRPGRSGRVEAAGAACNCAAEMKAILPELLRRELRLALRDLLLGTAVPRGKKRGKK